MVKFILEFLTHNFVADAHLGNATAKHIESFKLLFGHGLVFLMLHFRNFLVLFHCFENVLSLSSILNRLVFRNFLFLNGQNLVSCRFRITKNCTRWIIRLVHGHRTWTFELLQMLFSFFVVVLGQAVHRRCLRDIGLRV